MTLVAAHKIDGKLVVVTDGADAPGPKCCRIFHHAAIVAGWGDYDLSPNALCFPPIMVPSEQRHSAQANYVGDALPDLKEGKDKFADAFKQELNKAANVHNGGRGSAGLLLAFACDSTIESIVYDANSGKGSWQPRPGLLDFPAFFGQEHEVRNMLKGMGVKSPTEFVGAVTSVEDFAGKIKALITQTSEHMAAKHLVRSIGLSAWLLVLSKDGTVSAAKEVA